MARGMTQDSQSKPKQGRKSGFQPSLLSLPQKEQAKSMMLRLKQETEKMIVALEEGSIAIPPQTQAAVMIALTHLAALNASAKKGAKKK